MRALISVSALSAALLTAQAPVFAQEASYPLSRAAADLGYTYQFLPIQNAAVITRPGLVIVLRPGDYRSEINDQANYLDVAPRYEGSEVFVSDALVRKLKQLAAQYPVNPQGANDHHVIVVSQPTARGAVALEVRQLSGSWSLAVMGKAPPSVPITLTLIGSMSRDIPDVLLNRSEIASDVDGRFQAIVSIAPGFFDSGLLTLVATSLPGVSRASAQVVLKAPNWRAKIPADTIPDQVLSWDTFFPDIYP